MGATSTQTGEQALPTQAMQSSNSQQAAARGKYVTVQAQAQGCGAR